MDAGLGCKGQEPSGLLSTRYEPCEVFKPIPRRRSCHQLSISIQNPCEGFISFVDLPAGRRGNPSISYAVCSRGSWSNSHRPGSRQKPVLSKDPDHALSPKDAREVGSQLHRSVHISNIYIMSNNYPSVPHYLVGRSHGSGVQSIYY